jgi:hypothetical protein
MADENKPAFYPRVGRNIAKNFRSAQPPAFIEDPKAMDLPQFGDADLSVPSKENLEMARRMAERDAQLKRQQEADRSPLEKLAGGLQAGRFLGSAMTQAINSAPTRLFKGDEAADKFMQERIYKPEQPLAYEYAGDVGDFLEKLETEYKIPPVLPEAVALQFLTAPATAQAARAAGKGAVKAGMALERGMEPVVKGALERGGLPREMVMAMGANTQSNVMKPSNKANWLGGPSIHVPEGDAWRFKTPPFAGETPAQRIPHHEELLKDPTLNQDQLDRVKYQLEQAKGEAALDKWADTALMGYFKGQLASPEDPVRLMIERNYAGIESKFAKDQERATKMAQRAEAELDPRKQANMKRQADTMFVQARDDRDVAMQNISHLPSEMLQDITLDPKSYIKEERVKAGYPAEGLGTTDPSRKWEHQADEAVKVTRAGDIQGAMDLQPRLDQALQEQLVVYQKLNKEWGDLLRSKGLQEKDIDALMTSMPRNTKAEAVGMLDELQKADSNYLRLLDQDRSFPKFAAQDNPFVAKLDPETKMYSGYMGDLGFEHVMDVLRQDLAAERLRPEQLNKLSVEQAVKRTQEYNLEMARKMNSDRASARANLPVYKDYPDGYKWVQLNQPGNFAAESQAMGHSVKGYEPRKGDPDWVEGSGNEGSPMYGHGGWEAIKSGRAKVYSLVDSRGAPHATVEIKTNVTASPNDFRVAGLDYSEAMAEAKRRMGLTPETEKELTKSWDGTKRAEASRELHNIIDGIYKERVGEMPQTITQIKGKGNNKPIADYIPYVQDFVRSGNWHSVDDFHHTDLISADTIRKAGWDMKGNNQKFFTKQEYEDLKNAEQKRVEGDGMKSGGKVSISNNPDTMMLEVNNQKMKNGVPAYGAGKAVTKMGLKAAKNEVPRIAMQFGNDLPLNMADDLIKRSPSVDRINMNYKDVTKRVPELTEAAQRLQAGELDRETYAKLVQALKPVKPYDFVPKPATAEEAMGALKEDARDTYGVPSQTLEAGHPVGLRLDIPAYTNKGVWVPTVHEQDSGFGAGKKIGHESVASVLNPEFGMSEKAALSIASGKPKGTIATIKGDWNPTSEAEVIAKAKEYLKHPEWRQVGMDPERHSYFYDRETMAPVVNAEEVIQIGPLVLAKNPKFGKPEDFKYAKGGLTGAIDLAIKAAKPAISDAERALPLSLPRAMPKSKAEINAHAERVARQIMGEHVTSGKAGDTKNLAGRSLKESQRVKKLEYEFVPTKDVPESQPIQSQIGDINVALPGDFTVSDVELKSLMGEPINSRQEGGSRYGLGHLEDELPLFYASNEGPAQMVQDKVSDLYSLYEPERVMGQHMAMGPIATNFAQHFADANLKYTDYSKLRGADMDMFDQIMSHGYEVKKTNKKTGEVTIKIVDFPTWPGIADPQAAYEAMKRNPEMRKFYNRIMQTPSITEPLGFPSGQDVRYAITSPDLRDMEVNLTGHGVGQLFPNVDLTDTADHNTYAKGIRGIYKGHQDVLSPFAISYPDATQHIITHQRPQDFTGTIQKVFPHQRVDQQFIDEMEQYRRRLKELTGKKEGGYIKKPAAYINGDEFVDAAKKYGIKDSMNNLNMIVNLVNKGLSVDDAARQVADSGMHKAAGGAISGDDLILEERPL